MGNSLVNLFHRRLLVVIVTFEGRQFLHFIIAFLSIVVFQAEPQFHQTMDAGSECGWFVQREATRKKRGIVQQPDQIFDRLVSRILISFFSKRSDDGWNVKINKC